MTTMHRADPVDSSSWNEALSALGGAAITGAVGVVGLWWKGRQEHATKALEAGGARAVAQIEADSSERIHMLTILSARVQNLEEHNELQDRKIEELVIKNAELQAQNTLLLEQNKLLRRQVTALEDERDSLREEVAVLRDSIQGPISDALEALDEDY